MLFILLNSKYFLKFSKKIIELFSAPNIINAQCAEQRKSPGIIRGTPSVTQSCLLVKTTRAGNDDDAHHKRLD